MAEHETVTKADVDSKITTHAGVAGAHHAKTGDDEVYGLFRSGLDANKPAAGVANRYYWAIDTKILYRDTGAAWEETARGETAIRLAQLAEKQHANLTGIGASDHHAKYTDAEAKAAAVQAGAITNGVTKAPTHDAVYDVKVTADTATTPAEVDSKIATHKGDASAHHAKTTIADLSPIALADLDPAVCSETECDNKIAAIPSDDVAATPSLRTLGSGAQQAAPGNHTHTLTVARAFYLANSKVTGTTSWVEMASTLIPSNAKKVIGWCFGSSDTSLKIGECRTLYNGVQKAYASGAFYSITPVMWNDDGLGFAANLTIEIKKNVDANKIVYGYGADYVTT